MPSFNPKCIVGNAVLNKGMPQSKFTSCIGSYY
jgi:hypothetical protein